MHHPYAGTGTGHSHAGIGYSAAEFDRSELTIALHELAQDHETPVPVPGSEIRHRAVGRRRRRKVSLAAAGATVAAALALVATVAFTGGEGARSTPPAATYSAPTQPATTAPSPARVAATVDLSRRVLAVGDRTLPISSGAAATPTPTGLMTVTAKWEAGTVPGEPAGLKEYDTKATWVMRLRAPNDRTNYLLALTWDEKAPGNYDTTGGLIGLRSVDAKWLYGQLGPGSVVEVVGAAPRETGAVSGGGSDGPAVASPSDRSGS
ncbi:L,D-transpeptidase [Streptomyces sp. 2A115]|uniref:L,D-transpeptidase n=1 Tax=Streptomyces sp. 2A115 TaxID=3457439 RepID=UPI003FD69E29